MAEEPAAKKQKTEDYVLYYVCSSASYPHEQRIDIEIC